MNNQTRTYGNGIHKTSARELAVLVDNNGDTWICDKDAVNSIDHSKPYSEQSGDHLEVMPFDYGG